jgi:DNA endonuclease
MHRYLSLLSTLERQRVYEEVRRLKAADPDMDTTSLRLELRRLFEVLPSRMTLRRWLDGATSPTSSMNRFEAVPSPELSFFLGAWIGDGWADKNDGGTRLLLKVRSFDFASAFAESAKKVLQKKNDYWVRRVNGKTGRWYLVKVTSMTLFDFVGQPLGILL